jgi:hypothetical protein
MGFRILSSIYKVFGIHKQLAGVFLTGELRLPSDEYTGQATNLLMPNAQASPDSLVYSSPRSCLAHQ